MTRTRTAAVVGALALAGGALLVPAVASAQPADPGSRLSALRDALAGLVTDETITQEQADAVAGRLDQALPPGRGPGHRGGEHGAGPWGGPGGPGRSGGPGGLGGLGAVHLAADSLAEAADATVEELRTAFGDGTTLAELAASKGVTRSVLVARLVASAQERLDAAVADERLTQEQADERAAGLPERIERLVDRAGHGPRHGMFGGDDEVAGPTAGRTS